MKKEALKKYCESIGLTHVMTPKAGECVDVTSDTSVFKVILKDSLLRNINFVEVCYKY